MILMMTTRDIDEHTALTHTALTGAMRACSFLCQLRRHCRSVGSRMPDMPHAHQYGAAFVFVN